MKETYGQFSIEVLNANTSGHYVIVSSTEKEEMAIFYSVEDARLFVKAKLYTIANAIKSVA